MSSSSLITCRNLGDANVILAKETLPFFHPLFFLLPVFFSFSPSLLLLFLKISSTLFHHFGAKIWIINLMKKYFFAIFTPSPRCVPHPVHHHVTICWYPALFPWTIFWTICIRGSCNHLEGVTTLHRSRICNVPHVRIGWNILQYDPSLGYVLLVV